MNRIIKQCAACFLFVMLFVLIGCQTTRQETSTGFYFNTVISVTVYEPYSLCAVFPFSKNGSDGNSSSLCAKELSEKCLCIADDYETLLSRTMEGSDIWNINHNAGKPVTVSEDTLTLLTTALSYAEASDGLVDPTIGSLSSLWDFSSEEPKTVPTNHEIEEALSHVNYKSIEINGNQVTLTDPDACIDLGFIAKGYIADRIKDYLVSEGVKSAIINLGGNVVTIGTKPDNSAYKVGIQKPFAETGTPLLSISVTDKSVVSSGNYERCFWEGNTLYHHILSTKDGYPVLNDLTQVTIISNASVDGDALSTLCFILGYEEGRKLIESLPDTEAVFVTQDGDIFKTYETETLPASTLR